MPSETIAHIPNSSTPRPLRVAYMMSRFPKITETFVLYELLAVERLGVEVEVYPLQREKTSTVHPEAVSVVQRAHFTPWISLAILAAHLHYLCRQPQAYFGVLWLLIRANWGSRRYLAGAVAFFPKAVFLARRMESQSIDHVHAHFASHPAAVAVVIHRLTGIPFSFTAHGSDLHRDRHMLREKVADASFVVVVSEYNQRVVMDECGEEVRDRIRVIHCGVDIDTFHSVARDITGDADASKTVSILCVGTIHEVKGQAVLIDACRLLKQRGVSLSLHFVGDGPELRNRRRQVQQTGLADVVTFHGRRSRQEVVRLLHEADIVVAPSVPSRDGRREGIPVALMEAMASGAAVVASRLSGIPELVQDGHNGLLVEPRDAAGLADAIEHVARDQKLRNELATAGRETVERQFNLAGSVDVLVRQFHLSARPGTASAEHVPCAKMNQRETQPCA